MQYTQPYGVTDPNAGYVNANPATGQQGSIPPAAAIEAPQREIVAVIQAAGLTPDPANNAQLLQALQIAANSSAVDSGTQNAMSVNFGPGFNLATFATIRVKAANTVTGPSTIHILVNSVALGTWNLTRSDGTALNPYDVVANEIFTATYDGTEFQLQKSLKGNTGDIAWALAGTSKAGYVPLNGQTIGNAASSATGRANADCAQLFAFLWNNFSNTLCPVSGGRTASAAADFAANKTITLPDTQCKALIGVDGMGGASATSRLTGVPVTAGAAATPGSTLGEALHTLIAAELAAHNHSTTESPHVHGGGQASVQNEQTGTPASAVGWASAAGNTASASTGLTVNNNGSGTAHDNTQLSYTTVIFARL